ncbi:hypothetical protein GAS18_20985 [Burkholderia glumae]|nr:hypothetical protein GAS18_20985 [Burkholderia glumae]
MTDVTNIHTDEGRKERNKRRIYSIRATVTAVPFEIFIIRFVGTAPPAIFQRSSLNGAPR